MMFFNILLMAGQEPDVALAVECCYDAAAAGQVDRIVIKSWNSSEGSDNKQYPRIWRVGKINIVIEKNGERVTHSNGPCICHTF